jgi:ribosomal protein S27E
MELSKTERAALAQITAVAGPVLVMDVTAEPVTPCRCCGEAISYTPEGKRRSIADPGWIHVTTGSGWCGDGRATAANQMACPHPSCPGCRSERYVYSQTPWGNQWDCEDCGRHDYFSIGD